MIEFGRNFGRNFVSEVRRIRLNWLGIGLIGGGFLAAAGCDDLTTGSRRFQTAIQLCEKKLNQLDPPVYTLKNPTDVCARLDQGIPSKIIIAEFEEYAESLKPAGIVKLTVGASSALAALGLGFGPMILNSRRRRP